jgi:hypothetical protein
MKLLTVLAATAVAAAVAAALSISAGADPSAGEQSTRLATCLHARGAAGAPSAADALKRWLTAHPDDAAVKACTPQSGAPTELVACLRAHRLDPPGNLMQLKPWMARQAATDAGKAALNACGVDFNPPRSAATGKDFTACLRSNGADIPAGADGLALKTWVRDHSGDVTPTPSAPSPPKAGP